MTLAVLDTSAADPDRQFEQFYEAVCSRIIRVTPQPPEPAAPFPARVVSRSALGRSCHLIDAPLHTARRTPRDIRSGDPEVIHLNCMLTGERRILAAGTEATAGPGHIFALDTRRPFDLLGAGGRYRALKIVIPAAAVGARGCPISLPPQRLRAHRLCGLLAHCCRRIAEGLDRADDVEIATLIWMAECLFGLMARGEGPEAIEEGQRELFLMVGLEIDRRLADACFGLDELCASLGTSRRHVQRALARHGTTFSEMLRRRRMERARRRLASTVFSVEQIIAECGYTEVSAFYRAFRREFGETPASLRRADATR